MAEIISIANQKGGVGKTTTAINFCAALANLGQDTLLIDLDPQGNSTSGLGFNRKDGSPGIYDNLIEDVPLKKTIKATSSELLDIICSSPNMMGAEIELVDLVSRENRLSSAISKFSECYSFIVIDCPPSLGLLTINALAASDKVLIPIQGEYYALEGLALFLDAIRRLQHGLNPRLKIEGGVLTMFDPRYVLAQQIRAELNKFLKQSLYTTAIPRAIRLAEAPSFGKTIFQYDPRSRGSEAYLALAGEFLGRRGWRGMRLN